LDDYLCEKDTDNRVLNFHRTGSRGKIEGLNKSWPKKKENNGQKIRQTWEGEREKNRNGKVHRKLKIKRKRAYGPLG